MKATPGGSAHGDPRSGGENQMTQKVNGGGHTPKGKEDNLLGQRGREKETENRKQRKRKAQRTENTKKKKEKGEAKK